jgi:hypothetical protein
VIPDPAIRDAVREFYTPVSLFLYKSATAIVQDAKDQPVLKAEHPDVMHRKMQRSLAGLTSLDLS